MIRVISNLFIPFIFFNIVTRLTLFAVARMHGEITADALSFNKVFIFGGINDLVTFTYIATLSAVFYLLIFPLQKYKVFYRYCGKLLYFLWIFALCFIVVSEYFFWEEFGSKFNFIAVDYLVYTREVLGNISESYPLTIIVPCIFMVSLGIYLSLAKYCDQDKKADQGNSYQSLIAQALAYFTIALVAFCSYSPELLKIPENRYMAELAKNGVYELFSAFRNNQLQYSKFYQSMHNKEAFSQINKILHVGEHKSDKDGLDIIRNIITQGKEKKYNVIVLSVESLSAGYLSHFGGKENATPYLDKLAQDSLFFTNYYATGTRTVRGLEAMTLSVPPTPGNSIIRRPNNQNLFTIHSVLKQYGYDSKFIYGGYGYFDNMNNFFAGNGFTTIDRSNIKSENISFANIWGVCDGDLYGETLRQADEDSKNNKPFFYLVMTTSNHRPYTFPDNLIEVTPDLNRRISAVKYTDYAIAKFIEEARKKPWFDQTIFVITADHCASSASKSEMDVSRYHIPLMIYAPKLLAAQRNDHLASQIDLAPTILGLLNMPYKSQFYGMDIIKNNPKRALISTYQKLGLVQDGKLVILSPKNLVSLYKIVGNDHLEKIAHDKRMLDAAISYYQTADYLFSNNLMNEK